MADPDAPGPGWWVVEVDPRWLIRAIIRCQSRAHALWLARQINDGQMSSLGISDPNRWRPTICWVVLSGPEVRARWPWIDL